MHVALTGLPPLRGSEAARRLHIAAGILDHGFLTPLGLLEACGFDCAEIESLAKAYDPDEPRVPKGNPDGGQWTRDGTKILRGLPSRRPSRQSWSRFQRRNPVLPHPRLSEAPEFQSRFSGGRTNRLGLATHPTRAMQLIGCRDAEFRPPQWRIRSKTAKRPQVMIQGRQPTIVQRIT